MEGAPPDSNAAGADAARSVQRGQAEGRLERAVPGAEGAAVQHQVLLPEVLEPRDREETHCLRERD